MGAYRGFIEGDYVETVEGLFFAVKGLIHPDGYVVAYLRYVPDDLGDRVRGGKRYRRVYDIAETTNLLKERYPLYLNLIEPLGQVLQSVPLNRIARVYKPRQRLGSIMADPQTGIERTIKKFVSAILEESGVPLESVGVSGSDLIGLASPDSDIDLNIYGRKLGLRAYEALKRLRGTTSWISPYDKPGVRGVVRARWGDTGLDLERLTEIEVKKVLHGKACGRDYFLRLVKEPGEVEAEVNAKQLGKVTLRAVVADSRDSIFTPCSYGVEDVVFVDPQCGCKVSELVSFRGKFTEQAEEGELVEARGTLERVEKIGETDYRVVLGVEGDYLVPVGILDR